MPWISLGILNPHPNNWTTTPIGAIDQDFVKISFLNPSGNYDLIKSRILLRRKWDTNLGGNFIERAIIVYPSPSDTVILMPIASDFLEAGLTSYKLEIKKLWRRGYAGRPVITEPVYSLNLEVR